MTIQNNPSQSLSQKDNHNSVCQAIDVHSSPSQAIGDVSSASQEPVGTNTNPLSCGQHSPAGKTNLVLIGMPAAGKSTAGVILAKMLGMDFMDTDLLIQRREKKRLETIIREEGISGFLSIENAVCMDIHAEDTVIATGGSVIYSAQAMAHLKEIGTVIYLEVPFSALQERLQDIRGRGVVLADGQTLEELFQERSVLYRRYADFTISEEGRSLEETVQALYALKN